MLTTTSSKRSRHPPRHLVHHQPPRPMGKVLTCFSYLPSVIHLAMRAAFAKGAWVSSQRECMWERERETLLRGGKDWLGKEKGWKQGWPGPAQPPRGSSLGSRFCPPIQQHLQAMPPDAPWQPRSLFYFMPTQQQTAHSRWPAWRIPALLHCVCECPLLPPPCWPHMHGEPGMEAAENTHTHCIYCATGTASS